MVSGSSKNDSPLAEISNLSAKKHSSSLNNSLKKSKLRACEYSSRVKKSLVGYFPKVIQVAAAECENANPNVKDLESVVVDLREIERRLQRDLDLRNAEVERLANKVEMLELEKENFVREVSSLRMEISSAKSQIQVLKGAESSLKGFEIELEGLRSKNSQLEHQKSELECQLKKAESQLSCGQSDVEKSMQRPPRGRIPSSPGQLRWRLQSGTESTDNLSSNSCQETGQIFKQLSLEQKMNFPLGSYTDAVNASSYSSSTSETGKSDGSDKFQGSVGLSTLSRRYFKARKSLKGSDNWFFPHEDSQSVNSSPRPSFSGSDDSNEDQKENVSDNLPNEACMPKNKRHRKNDEKQDRVIDRSVPRIPKPLPKASCDTAAYMTNNGEALGTRNDANLRKAPRIPRPPPKPSPSSTSPANKSFGLNSKSAPPPPPPPPPPISFPLKISNGSVPRPPPPPPLSLSLKGSCSSTPPPPPPPSLLLHKQSTTTAMQRVPEVAEFYHSLMRRDQRKDSSGNVHVDSPDVANVRSNMIGEIENRSSHLMAIKTDVETQGDFVRSLIREVRTAAYSNIEDLVEFVKWLDEELSFLVDERAVLKHFDWPERKADALREASFAYSDLKKLVNEVSSYKDDHRQPCNVSLKKMTSLLERLERKVYAFLQMRDMTMSRYKEFQIPYDWMLDTGIISQIKLASVKLAKIYMRRVTMELEHIVSTENESMQDTLVVQGVRFAFRVHQFAGGFDAESMSAFEQLKNLAQMCQRH